MDLSEFKNLKSGLILDFENKKIKKSHFLKTIFKVKNQFCLKFCIIKINKNGIYNKKIGRKFCIGRAD